eukprot:GHVR01058930.1.p2 GENE.GHVR01058930.1~~GHVR01058930.1.p2  ORF type:complete len:139 (+),score=12.40 GHVR01058930.1:731-1147(+)
MMNSISITHSHLFLLDAHNEDYLYMSGGVRNFPLWYVVDLLFSVRDGHLIDDTSLDKDKIILLCRQLYMSNLVHSFFVLSYKLYNNEATLYVPLMKQLLIHTDLPSVYSFSGYESHSAALDLKMMIKLEYVGLIQLTH